MTSLALTHGIYDSGDMEIVRVVFDRISTEPGFSPAAAHRTELARYILRMYARGLVAPEKLEALCRVATQHKFLFSGIEGRRFLIVEDDFYLAIQASQRLESLGAEALKVPSLALAMQVVESDDKLDGALLDINVGGEMVYPVAALLKMRQVPFAFVSGYDARVLPASYRHTAVFPKPADWALAAGHVAGHRSCVAA